MATTADVQEFLLPGHEQNPVEVKNPPNFESIIAIFWVLGGPFLRWSRRLQKTSLTLEVKPPKKKKITSKIGGASGSGKSQGKGVGVSSSTTSEAVDTEVDISENPPTSNDTPVETHDKADDGSGLNAPEAMDIDLAITGSDDILVAYPLLHLMFQTPHNHHLMWRALMMMKQLKVLK